MIMINDVSKSGLVQFVSFEFSSVCLFTLFVCLFVVFAVVHLLLGSSHVCVPRRRIVMECARLLG